jgi:hypothetical protein
MSMQILDEVNVKYLVTMLLALRNSLPVKINRTTPIHRNFSGCQDNDVKVDPIVL